MADADVIVVGAGHNGLICAAYLAKAGIDTLLLDARSTVGGLASTEADLGARFNICNCDHTMIRAMPIIDELDLESHGLRYLESDVSSIQLFHDGSEPFMFFHEVERQLDELAAVHPRQVEGYRRYLADATPVIELSLEIARTIPSTPAMVATALRRKAAGAATLLKWSRRSLTDVLGDYFDDWHLVMPAISSGPTMWGASPDAPGTGSAAGLYATRHLVKSGRPVGGSGGLTDSIRSRFEAAGGRVQTSARVERLLVGSDGVEGVVLEDGTVLSANTVVAACDPQRVYVDWVDEVPPAARKAVARWADAPEQPGYQSKLDAIIRQVPRYEAFDQLAGRVPGVDLLEPTLWINPSPEKLAVSHALRKSGRVVDQPTMLTNVPSVLDDAMRTASGDHVLSLEVLFTPYGGDEPWDRDVEPKRWLDLWSRNVQPGMLDNLVDYRVMTPERYDADFSMHKGHTPSFSAPPLKSLLGLQRDQTRYRSPIAGLYLSGAGTFPGAGVFGAPGRNAAHMVIHDLNGRIGAAITKVRRTVKTLGA
ncbi:MAG: NAD(P)/FAD-dependent oxidoreductase [Acidimicrobiales bacterium]